MPEDASRCKGYRTRHTRYESRYARFGRRWRMAAPSVVEQLETRRLLAGLVVDTLNDENDGIGTGGVSLRDAIAVANANAGDNFITFDASLTSGGPATLTLTLGQLSFTDTTGKTTISGPGFGLLSVNGNNAGRVFSVAAGASADISGLTITGGHTTDAGFSSFAGGIANDGTLTLTDTAISGNESQGNGGGIYNNGTLTLINSTVAANTVGIQGGGIYNTGTLTLTDSTISGNIGGAQGAGIYNTGTLTATNSTIAGNNLPSGNGGGGIYSSHIVNLTNCTISANTASTAGGGIQSVPGPGNSLTINNTIVAGNHGSGGSKADDINGIALGANNLVGVDTGLVAAFNGVANGVNGNHVGTSNAPINPLLGALTINWGFTQTMSILPNSAAFNAGSNALIPSGVTTDQRGLPRIFGSAVDIGAFELQASDSLIVTTLVDEDDGSSAPAFGTGTSLREAISYANAHVGDDTISFAPALTLHGPATLSLTGGQLAIASNISIIGPGAQRLTIEGNNASRVFAISGNVVAGISGLTITGGRIGADDPPFGTGGGIDIGSSATVTVSYSAFTANHANGLGGAIYNLGALTVIGSTFSDNHASYGGGIFSQTALTVTNSTFSANDGSSGNGGAVYIYSGTATVTNSTIAGNTIGGSGGDGGGGIFNASINSLILNNTLIAQNHGSANADDVHGPASGGNNLIGVDSGLTGISNGVSGNKIGTAAVPINPKLGALAYYGGPTQTMPLRAASPAINAGSNALVPNGLTTDQRGPGFARIRGTKVDIGAFEYKLLAESLLVTTLADEDDATSDPAFGAGTSLREAIGYANAHANAHAGPDTITFAPSLTSHGPAVITLILGELLLSDTAAKTRIVGPGATRLSVNGNDAGRVLEIASNALADISGLTITGGHVTGIDPIGSGGGIFIGASARVTLTGCIISGNLAEGLGGGIFNHGSLAVVNSTIAANQGSSGGGIFASGLLKVTGSTFVGNGAAFVGGGIYAASVVILNNSTLCANTAAGSGGGVLVSTALVGVPAAPLGTLTASNCTFSLNVAGDRGGGIYASDVLQANNEITLNNSLCAGNTAAHKPDISGPVVGSFNLIGDGTGATGLTQGVQGNKIGTSLAAIDPKLGPLADNGGPTHTMALLAGSPAFNAGSNALIPSALSTDQRGSGFPRIFATTVDIGAYEARPPVAHLNTPAKLRQRGKQPYLFTVVYTDPSQILLSSIGNHNIRVTGPGDFGAFATEVSTVQAGNSATVIYRLAAPRGGWTAARNGKYSVVLQGGQIKDLLNLASPLTALGMFTVAI